MNRLSKIFALLLLILSGGLSANATDKKNTISLEQASEMVREQSKGKVLSARTTHFNGSRTHRIQVLTPSGRVKIFQIPLDLDKHKNQKYNGQKYSNGRLKVPTDYSNRSNYPNYRTPNTNTTSRNNTTTSNGGKKQK